MANYRKKSFENSRESGTRDRENRPNHQGKARESSRGAKRNSKPKRGKEVEFNIPDSQLNMADLSEQKKLGKHPNDFSWYNHYPVLAENCSGVNYATAVGAKINYLEYGASAENKLDLKYAYSAPGVCSIYFLPTYGKLDGTVEAPLGRVWSQLYSAMRIKLGSRADYDPTDTLTYVMMMDSCYIIYALAVRAYGLTNQVTPFNLYVMRKLCEACGISWQSVSANRANFRDLINQYAIALSKWMVPGDFDLFRRRVWMIQNLFTDSETAKAQIYAMIPEGYYQLEEQTEGDKKLVYKAFVGSDSGRLTVDDFSNIMQSMMLILENSQDVIQMSADIGKAWEGKVLAAALIPESYTTPISYSKEVLSQLENVVLVGNPINSGDITPTITVNQVLSSTEGPRLEQRNLWFAGSVSANGSASTKDKVRKFSCSGLLAAQGVLNFHWTPVTNQDSIIASRGTTYGVRSGIPTGQTLDCVQLGSFGTEVYTRAQLFAITSDGNMYSEFYSYFLDHEATSLVESWWSSFDWAPAYFLITGLPTYNYAMRMQDLDMYGVIDHGQIDAMHYNCVLSEFYSDIYPESIVNMPSR